MGCGASISAPTSKQGNSLEKIEIRIMLIGKTGAGKSTLGNVILDKPIATFTEGDLMDSTTPSCLTGSREMGNKNIVILDTPGVMGTSQDEEHIVKEIFRGTNFIRPGPHVFLLVIRADAKFTKEETEAVEIFRKVFGKEMSKHCILVFTHKSALDKNNKTEEYCLQKLPGTFGELKECCIAIETGGKKKQVRKEVQKLLQIVEMQRNKGGFYLDEKIKEKEKEYMARIEANRDLRAKGKEQFQEIAGSAYDTVADAAKGVKEMVTGKVGAVIGAVQSLF